MKIELNVKGLNLTDEQAFKIARDVLTTISLYTPEDIRETRKAACLPDSAQNGVVIYCKEDQIGIVRKS